MSAAWLRWLLVPWRNVTLVVALVCAAATPVFLVSTAGLWRTGAGDVISELLVSDGRDSNRVVAIESNVLFNEAGIAMADRAVNARLADIDAVGSSTRTLSTPRGLVANGQDSTALSVPVRLVNHDTAIQTVDYVRHLPDEFEGAWISGWMAQRFDVDLGDTLTYFSDAEPEEPGAEFAPGGGDSAEILVVGIYEELWNEEGTVPPSDRGIDLSAFLESMPAELRPSYINPFQAPSFSLVFVDDAVMAQLGVSGTARWAAPIETSPTTRAELSSLVDEITQLERIIVRDPTVVEALQAQAGPQPAAPVVTNSLAATLDSVDERLQRLDQPLQSTQLAGAAIGLFVMVSAASLAVARRKQEFALLASEGDRWEQFTGRALLQLFSPTAVGVAVGLVLAAVVGATMGPAASSLDARPAIAALDVRRAVLVGGAGWLTAAAATGLLGQRALRTALIGTPSTSQRAVAVGAGLCLTAFTWIEVGAGSGRTDVDLSVVTLPVVALLTGVALVLALAKTGSAFTASQLATRSPIGLLAWRRATRANSASQAVTAALTVSLGLAGFSAVLVNQLDEAASSALFTEVGGQTVADLVGLPPENAVLPNQSTIVGIEETTAAPGQQPVRIVAIDPTSARDAFDWPHDAPLSFSDAAALLASDTGTDLPVLAISSESLPTTGSFGITEPFPYRVVGDLDTIPLASGSRSTLIVSSERLDAFSLSRTEDALTTLAPSQRLRQHLISQQDRATIERFLDDNNVRSRSVTTVDERRASVDYVVPTFAFGYLRWLGVTSVLTALASLAFYLASQRATRKLGTFMTQRMGLSPGQVALVTTLEVAVLISIATATALAIVPLIVRRSLPRFDPAPTLPPGLDLGLPWLALGGTAIALVAFTSLGAWSVDRLANAQPDGSIVRAQT